MAKPTLTPQQVERIRWVYAQRGHPTQHELAAYYGVNPSTISRIVTGISWRQADGPVFTHPPRREVAR